MQKIFETTHNHAKRLGDDIMNRDTSNVFDAARYLLQDPPMQGDSVHASTTNKENNSVNAPKHYRGDNMQCIDAMEAMLSHDEFRGFLRGNIFKYMWRYKDKNGIEDLRKANWYLDRLIKFENF